MSENGQLRRSVNVRSDIPKGYHTQRLNSWESNASFWARYVDSDRARFAMLDSLAKRVAMIVRRKCETPSITDFGCGEGLFLRLCHQYIPNSILRGIDFCDSMLSLARERSNLVPVQFFKGDVEDENLTSFQESDLVTSIMTLDEVDSLDVPFRNIASTMKKGALAVVLTLDPVIELLRHRQYIAPESTHDDSNPPNGVLVIKHFLVGTQSSPAPYNRVIRPLANYFRAAARHGLQVVDFEEWPPQSVTATSFQDPVFDIMFFRKTSKD